MDSGQVSKAAPALQVQVCMEPHSLHTSLSLWKGYFALAGTEKTHLS